MAEAGQKGKRQLFYTGIILNVIVLLFYKLLQDLIFISKGNAAITGFDNTKWILLGIGFYTLQFISNYIDVFKRGQPFTLSYTNFFLTNAFFSKVPAGPIINLKQANTVFDNKAKSFDSSDFSYGVQRILLGLFKKVALADRLLPFVNSFYDQHNYHNGMLAYLSPFLFTLQLYFDFSGYIDIAIGSARLFGIRLPENFNFSLRATSIVNYWRRWHITLVQWLTNYVYYPVSFRYRKLKRRGVAIAIIATFVVSSLWHGLAITFFIWAACHFTYMIIENMMSSKVKESYFGSTWLGKALSVIVVWHLIAFSNIFFRSSSLQDAIQMLSDITKIPFLGEGVTFNTWLINGGQDIENEFNFRISILLCFLFLLLEKKANRYAYSKQYNILYVSLMMVLIVVFGMFDVGERFIYLQF